MGKNIHVTHDRDNTRWDVKEEGNPRPTFGVVINSSARTHYMMLETSPLGDSPIIRFPSDKSFSHRASPLTVACSCWRVRVGSVRFPIDIDYGAGTADACW
jgi:hypothetical protein